MLRLRALQDETGGFTAFITWSYQPEHTERGGARSHRHRIPAHAGDRAPGPRQLRQPAGVVGDAGRQGRAVEPGLRRQRHGQRDDRRERRPRRRRRRIAWTKSRSSATSRTRASPPSAATCTTTSSAIRSSASTTCQRMLELSTAREAGDTSVPGGARELSGPQRRREEAALAAADIAGLMTAYRAAWVCPIDQPPIADGVVDVDGGRIVGSRGSGIRDPAGSRARFRDLGNVRSAAGPRQRSHPPRVVVAARSRAAGAEVHRLGEDAVCDARPAGCGDVGRADRADSRGDRRSAGERHRCRRRHQQLAGRGRADARSRPRRRGVSRAAGLQGARRRAGRIDARDASRPPPTPARGCRWRRTRRIRRRSSCSGRFARRSTAIALSDHERPSWRVGRGDRVPRERQRPVARRCSRSSACGATTGRFPAAIRSTYLDRARRDRREARWSCTACSSTMRPWPAGTAIGATLVTCPRSNQWVGVGDPPIERFYRSGVDGRGRHRQPGQRRGPEPVLRAEDDALRSRRVCRRRRFSRAPRWSARARWGSATNSAR